MSLGRGFVSVGFADDLRGPLGWILGHSSVLSLGSLCGCSLLRVLRLVCVLRSSLRGLFGRSFLHATVPLPVPSWTPADSGTRPRSGNRTPDTDKICSIVLRDSSPLHNQDYAWPQRPGQGDTSSWQGAAGIRSPSGGESTPSQQSKGLSVFWSGDATLQ